MNKSKKNVSGPSNPPDELAQNVSKKNPFRTNYSSFFSAKVQNLAVFSFIYMIRIRFFGPQELIQNGFRRARYRSVQSKSLFWQRCPVRVSSSCCRSVFTVVLSFLHLQFVIPGVIELYDVTCRFPMTHEGLLHHFSHMCTSLWLLSFGARVHTNSDGSLVFCADAFHPCRLGSHAVFWTGPVPVQHT